MKAKGKPGSDNPLGSAGSAPWRAKVKRVIIELGKIEAEELKLRKRMEERRIKAVKELFDLEHGKSH